jgi:small ligand-binding sensory domain FIST
VVREALAADAVGGLFAAGEIGPVGGRSYLHGFTASMLLLP